GVLVNVPRPGRFALHKLIIAARRAHSRASGAKAAKDRAQASALLRVLLSDLPGEITLAWRELARRGKSWTAAARQSISKLDEEIAAGLRSLGLRM
ncbi:MAG TPA: GSU2403 family nucleotidyltransferase fold protein, partial [Polyangia bacterium]|nr:GSU2403 family nucleotidyltransferase fold protein [Polyangia bacterium]